MGRGWRAILAIVSVAVVAPAAAPAGANAFTHPRVRVIAGADEVTFTRGGHYGVPINLAGLYIGAQDAPLDIRVSRANYSSPITAEQWLDGGAGKIPLPPEFLDGWIGLKDFTHTVIRNNGGTIVSESDATYCPLTFDSQRIDDTGPDVPVYPWGCGANPFTLGTVWGIDRGWSTPIFDWDGGVPEVAGPDGHYTVEVSISQSYVDFFGIAPGDATAMIDVTLKTVSKCDYGCYGPEGADSRAPEEAAAASPQPGPAVPDTTTPDPGSLPDLVALPAWDIGTHQGRYGNDFLDFGATVWNRGPGPMVVEGYRQPGSDLMDAFQYFYLNGVPIGRNPAGFMEFERGHGHNHWHMEQFARYSLLDSSKQQVLLSHKESFCLAPTDAIDLLTPGANWNPDSIGLETACGDASSIWIRETLDTGWGDTYFQWVSGQAINISKIPNGKYYLKVEANPENLLLESGPGDNTSLRLIKIYGPPGDRRVQVAPWHGINA